MQLKFPKKLEPLFHEEKRKRHNLIEGGRGSAKSWTIADLLLLEGLKRTERILCCREVQKSISESVHTLLNDKIIKNNYPYKVTINSIKSLVNGTEFLFAGLKDHTIHSIKSYEGVTKLWGEEAQAFSKKSLDILIPTIRKETSQFFWTMNRFEDTDPIYDMLVNSNRDDVLHININYNENIYCPEILKKEAELCKKDRPEDYLHIWLGQPMSQGDNCILSRVKVKAAMDRTIEAEGQIEGGVDVARFGADKTQFYKRKGLKTIDELQLYKADTVEVSNQAAIALSDAENIKVDDTGVGGGVSDQLIAKGFNVEMVNFGGCAKDKDKYPDTISEMWFEFADIIDEIDIPDDRELLQQLTSRKYKFDNKGRRKVESKDDFKKRYGKSPDKADALLLCYYNSYSAPTIAFI